MASITTQPQNVVKAAPKLGTGPPTNEEIEFYYPSSLSWETVKDQVDSGDLGNLKRHPVMQIRYDTWIEGIKAQHGSIINYLVNIRLGWQDRSVSPSDGLPINEGAPDQKYITTDACPLPTPPPTRPFTPSDSTNGDESSIPKYFTSTLPSFYVKILPNDWPYSIPLAVKHFVFWSKVPIIHPGLVHPKIWEQVGIDGLWGFTGSPEGRTRTPRPNKNKTDLDPEEEESLLKIAHHEVELFVKSNWNEDEWETAWFVNPPRLQSIPGLAHGHVFARRKDTPTV